MKMVKYIDMIFKCLPAKHKILAIAFDVVSYNNNQGVYATAKISSYKVVYAVFVAIRLCHLERLKVFQFLYQFDLIR